MSPLEILAQQAVDVAKDAQDNARTAIDAAKQLSKRCDMANCPMCRGHGADPWSDNVNWLPCRACNGKGVVPDYYEDRGGVGRMVEAPCDACGGAGGKSK